MVVTYAVNCSQRDILTPPFLEKKFTELPVCLKRNRFIHWQTVEIALQTIDFKYFTNDGKLVIRIGGCCFASDTFSISERNRDMTLLIIRKRQRTEGMSSSRTSVALLQSGLIILPGRPSMIHYGSCITARTAGA